MIDWLRKQWFNLASVYTQDTELIAQFWTIFERHYTSKNRHYHNLSHIYNMLQQADSIKTSINDFDVFRFAIWYHDIIYKATKKNNELKSAEFAEKQLKRLNFDQKRLKNVSKLIKSTQNHDIVLSENSDNAYLLDIDLSVLGSDWVDYKNYTDQIRKEYAIYPDFIYKKGRKEAMLHFLERKRIYYSELYFNKFETTARRNIQKEIDYL